MSTEQLQLFNIESFTPAPAQTDWAFDVAGDYDGVAEEEWYLAQTAGINPETGEEETGEEYFTQTYRNHTAHFLKTEREWQIEFKFTNPDRPSVTLWTDTLDRDVAIRYFQKNVDGIIEYYHQKKHEVAIVFGWEKLHQLFPEIASLEEESLADEQSSLKSSHVPRNLVERANFQWVEEYPVKRGKYYYYRYCHLSDRDISQVNKIHIPKGNVRTSVGRARAEIIREAINSDKLPDQIIQMIRSWVK
jgi:hypothetical protein